jgi:DNA-binding PucR family transcriptional regulator
MGELPMKVHASIGMPTFWLTSAMGRTSATTVRAAQFAWIESPESTISFASP